MTSDLSTPAQHETCDRFGVAPVAAPLDLTVGLGRNISEGLQPINGLRHPQEGDTTGWYIWAGEDFPEDPGFFEPIHVAHLTELCPEVLPYLALPPGWRFLITTGYEDVWEDSSLLDL